MACGIHLGLLLLCLIQAEHICCSWATESQSYPVQYGKTYAGLSQMEGRSRLFGNNPQNQFRQVSNSPRPTQSSSYYSPPVHNSGYNQGYSKNNQMKTVSQPPQSGHSDRYVQSRALLRHTWATPAAITVQSPKGHKKTFLGLSTDIASSSSVAKYNANQDSFVHVKPKNQQRPGQYLSSTATSVKDHSGVMFSPAAHRPSSIAVQARPQPTRVHSNQPPPELFSKFFGGTSATVRARRVTSPGGSKSSLAHAKASAAYPRASAFGPRSLQDPTTRSFYQRPGYGAPSQNQDSEQTWNRPSQSGGSSSFGRPAPTKIHSIPQRFGGSPIRRLKKPDELKVASFQKPQQWQTGPLQQTASYNSQGQSEHKKSRWMKVRVG